MRKNKGHMNRQLTWECKWECNAHILSADMRNGCRNEVPELVELAHGWRNEVPELVEMANGWSNEKVEVVEMAHGHDGAIAACELIGIVWCIFRVPRAPNHCIPATAIYEYGPLITATCNYL